jgi:hypothetical protein
MHTMVGWFENQDSATLVAVAALADPHVRVVADDIIVPDDLTKLACIYGWGADITQGQLQSPSLRKRTNIDVSPLDSADEPTSNPPHMPLWENPIDLVPSEALNFFAAEDNAGAGDSACFVWLMDKLDEIPDGPIFTVRCTNATTLTADVWTNGALTFTQTLPAGRYAVVGMRAESAGLRAARLVPVGASHRPGVIGFDTYQDVEPEWARNGGIGVFCEFEHNSPPTCDFMSLSADSAQVVWLDLIQIREGKA